ncbi:WD40-repeat-containing domain protein [Phlyctochytrium arcticum]|nr:WD40-repeat-containing domain protein [Phlyctochytrium arcticum]
MVYSTLGENNPDGGGERLTKDLLQKFEIAKVFKDNRSPITSVDFDDSGEYCVTTSEDDSIRVYDAVKGIAKQFVYSKKYGCSQARFSHHNSSIIYASTKEDDTIRYLSVHDNRYLRYFKGHTRRVVGLEFSPQDDHFLSASLDESVRLWDLRAQHSQGLMNLQGSGRPCVNFDQTGKVFMVAFGAMIKLYDLRNFDKGSFATFPVQDTQTTSGPSEIIGVEFSNDGKNILVSTRGETNYILDGFNGPMKQYLRGHSNKRGAYILANFSPDGQFVGCGSDDGTITMWDAQSGNRACALPGNNVLSTSVRWNPKYMMFASADTNLYRSDSPPRRKHLA